MQGHQRDLGALVVGVGVADQRGVVEELVERFAAVARIHGGVHQFAQVFDAGVGLGRVFFFELLDVAGAVDQEFQKVGGAGGLAGVGSAGILPAVVEASAPPAHLSGEASRHARASGIVRRPLLGRRRSRTRNCPD